MKSYYNELSDEIYSAGATGNLDLLDTLVHHATSLWGLQALTHEEFRMLLEEVREVRNEQEMNLYHD